MVPNAGASSRAAGATIISRLRPTVAPAPGAFLAQPERAEERGDAAEARAAWCVCRAHNCCKQRTAQCRVFPAFLICQVHIRCSALLAGID